MTNMHDDMQKVFRDVFGDDRLILRDDMTANDVEGWDSLAHLNLIIAIEKRFGIKFANAEISRLKDEDQNVGTFIELVNRKLSGGH
jgi:acyl carrier protein